MFSRVATYPTKLLSEQVCMSCLCEHCTWGSNRKHLKTWHWLSFGSHTVGSLEHERNCLLIALFMCYVQQVSLSQHGTTRQNSSLIKILRENYLREIKMLVSATISSQRNVEVTGNVGMCFFKKVFSVSFQYLYNEKRKMQMWLIVLFILKLSAVYSWESPFMGRILFLSW